MSTTEPVEPIRFLENVRGWHQDTFPDKAMPVSSDEGTRLRSPERASADPRDRLRSSSSSGAAMPLVPLLVLLLAGTSAAQQTGCPPAAAAGFRPSGSPAELSDLGLLARLRAPGVEPVGFSSYDRTGGNNDGFNGTYSKLRVEAGNSILAEVSGPGVVQRIWFTHTSGEKPGLLDRKAEHLKIYLDGRGAPALDIPLEQVFAGTHPHFPRPLVSEGSGGFVSYVPIPFQNGCKILVEGLGVRFYQIGLVKLPPGTAVRSFTAEPSEDVRAQLARAASIWSQTDDYEETELSSANLSTYKVQAHANSARQYALRAGPATIRSIQLFPQGDTEAAWAEARMRIIWDDDDANGAGVDLPLGLFFGRIDGAGSYRSLLLGQQRSGWYNRFPMPYRRQAIVRIDSAKPLAGTLLVRTIPEAPADAGCFRAGSREAMPTEPKHDFSWLTESGRGQFAGVLLLTEGKAKLPYWLEGDDQFQVDGRLAIHGTGTEDYFNCGWYALAGRLDRPATYAVHGFPVYRNRGESWEVAAYRWHVADPVPFSRSIEAGIEHGGENTFPANYRAAVFWYSERPGPLPTAR
jgi:hypothetical protein